MLAEARLAFELDLELNDEFDKSLRHHSSL
jgi:hypothetical protein